MRIQIPQTKKHAKNQKERTRCLGGNYRIFCVKLLLLEEKADRYGTAHYLLYRGGLRRNWWGGGALNFFKPERGGFEKIQRDERRGASKQWRKLGGAGGGDRPPPIILASSHFEKCNLRTTRYTWPIRGYCSRMTSKITRIGARLPLTF